MFLRNSRTAISRLRNKIIYRSYTAGLTNESLPEHIPDWCSIFRLFESTNWIRILPVAFFRVFVFSVAVIFIAKYAASLCAGIRHSLFRCFEVGTSIWAALEMTPLQISQQLQEPVAISAKNQWLIHLRPKFPAHLRRTVHPALDWVSTHERYSHSPVELACRWSRVSKLTNLCLSNGLVNNNQTGMSSAKISVPGTCVRGVTRASVYVRPESPMLPEIENSRLNKALSIQFKQISRCFYRHSERKSYRHLFAGARAAPPYLHL